MAPRCIQVSEKDKRMELPKIDKIFTTTELKSLPGFAPDLKEKKSDATGDVLKDETEKETLNKIAEDSRDKKSTTKNTFKETDLKTLQKIADSLDKKSANGINPKNVIKSLPGGADLLKRSSSSDGDSESTINSPVSSDRSSRSSVTSKTFIYTDWPSHSSGKRSKASKLKLFSETPVPCAHCKKKVESKYLLYSLERYWHEKCLKCDFCRKPLFKFGSRFYFRQGAKFCHDDFARTFGGRGCCSLCDECIPPTEHVLKFNDNLTYHLRCFKCTNCESRFCVGDSVKIADPKHLICKDCDPNGVEEKTVM